MRPRERYAVLGPDTHSDEELVALLLGLGTASLPVAEIARSLLQAQGGLQGLLRASVAQLAASPGIGPARAVRLHVALQLGRRALCQLPDELEPVTDLQAARAWLEPRLLGLAQEEVHALYLDLGLRPLECRRLSRGTATHCLVDVPLVLEPALRSGARRIILAHNHPSGRCEPSTEDCRLTHRLREAASLLNLELVDHLIFAGGRVCSLRETLAWEVGGTARAC